jgi:hypothetical protein
MFDFLASGARVATTDDVAGAVLEYARVLAQQGRSAMVTFPAIVDGQNGETWMTVGAGLPLVAVRTEPEVPVFLQGTEFAVWNIRRRTAELDGEASDIDWDIRS